MLVRTRNTSNMRILRLILALYFLFLAGGALFSALPTQPSDPRLPHIFALSLRLTFAALAVIFVMGGLDFVARESLTELHVDRVADHGKSDEPSDRIRDSGDYLFLGYRSNFWHSNRGFAIPAIMGVLGLIVFRRDQTPKSIAS
jgi:hypothetical protein